MGAHRSADPQEHPDAAVQRSLDAAAEAIRRHGGRMTAAKRAILEILVGEAEDLTAEALCLRLPEVDHATVYRTLAQLEAAGVVDHRHLAHGPALYRWGGSPSIAVVCEHCGRVIELDRADFTDLSARVRAHGMVLSRGHFALSGRCVACEQA